MEQLTERVLVETGFRGSNNTAVVTGDGVVLVDAPQWPSDARQWGDVVRARGPVRYVLFSEYHWDHTRGATYFPEAVVIANFLIAERLAYAPDNAIGEYREAVKRMDPDGLPALAGYALRVPDVSFENHLRLYLGGVTFEMRRLPGHTAAQTVIHIPEERVLVTSDNVVNDLNPYMGECLPREWLNSLAEIRQYDTDFMVPGHGAVLTDKGPLDTLERYLRDAIQAVADAIEQGRSRDETVERINLLDRHPIHDHQREFVINGHRVGIGRLYDQLS